MSMKYAGADHVRWHVEREGKTMSPLGEKVADILGQTFRGIYHISDRSLYGKHTDWTDPSYIVVKLPRCTSLSTWDFADLTVLVILCHDACVRLEISASMDMLELVFHPRDGRTGTTNGHPTIERAVAMCREHFSLWAEEGSDK